MSLDQCPTARLYQRGFTREQAIAKGANPSTFDHLVEKYKDGAIPTHEFRGFKYRKPYSCAYHSGGQKGAILREIAASQRTKP